MKICTGLFVVVLLEDQQLPNYFTQLFILKLRNDGFAIAAHVPSAMKCFNWIIPAWEANLLREEPPAVATTLCHIHCHTYPEAASRFV